MQWDIHHATNYFVPGNKRILFPSKKWYTGGWRTDIFLKWGSWSRYTWSSYSIPCRRKRIWLIQVLWMEHRWCHQLLWCKIHYQQHKAVNRLRPTTAQNLTLCCWETDGKLSELQEIHWTFFFVSGYLLFALIRDTNIGLKVNFKTALYAISSPQLMWALNCTCNSAFELAFNSCASRPNPMLLSIDRPAASKRAMRTPFVPSNHDPTWIRRKHVIMHVNIIALKCSLLWYNAR
jgi:hypothetical protein